MATEPNQGAAGGASAPGATTAATAAGDPAAGPVNQGAAGGRPLGESPASVSGGGDAFDERPEAFVGAAFGGGLVLALILRRLAR